MDGTVGKHATFFPNRKQTSRAKEETVLEHNETQMQGFEYNRKNKEAETYTCRSCLQKWRTNRWAVPACLPLMIQRKPSSFTVRNFFQKLFRALLSSFPVK
jgi:hypothetical protein